MNLNRTNVEISNKTQKQVLEYLDIRFKKAFEKHGRGSFVSPLEAYGKLAEETYESLQALHKKDWKEFSSELLDVAVTALLGVMSSEEGYVC